MRKLSYIAIMACSLLAASCDMDIVPKGQSTLQKTTDLELMLNSKTISGRPHETLGLVVNEGYGSGFTTIKKQIEAENTLTAIYLTYNENVDRGALATKDNTYGDLYSNVYHYNVVIDKIDGADGNDNRKPSIKAEARISRAWNIFLAANIYARQYDAATAAEAGGVAYPEGTDVDTKPQLKLQECYELILADCSDEIIAQLPDKGNVNRITKAGGYAIRATVLFQMKRYDEALAYAEKALALNSTIEDRSYIVDTENWNLLPTSENNFFYISPLSDMTKNPQYERLSWETAELFEEGDYVLDYSTDGGYSPYWDDYYGYEDSGIDGCLEAYGDVYTNPWGLTVEQIMYLAAECDIRKGEIQKGLDMVNKVRSYRIHSDSYLTFTASSETDAMVLLQRAKFVECIGSFWNFFDRKRWNTEDKYRKTITRDLQDAGTYSIAPDSKLWVFPFPLRVMQNNPTFKQNYE